MSRQDEQRLLVKIASLYYREGLKQTEIAHRLSLSQSFISRALTRCQKEGIVKVSVIYPSDMHIELEKQIQDRFGIRQVICVDVQPDETEPLIKRAIGSAAAHYLETRLKAEDIVGISSWSSTIRAMVDELHANNLKARGVIQLLGGVGANGNVQATLLTQALAQQLHCDAWLLPSQSIEHSVSEQQKLVATPDVSDVLARFDDVTLAIVGIGKLEPSQLLKNSGNYYDETMLELLARRGAVGDLCLRYFNQQGQPVLHEKEDPVIGISLEKLKRCPHVIALASGRDKAKAIRGALKGDFIDVLITDSITAPELMA